MTTYARDLCRGSHAAGMAAGNGCTPTPMVVGTYDSLGNDIDYSKDTYYVADGMCGFIGLISNQREVSL